MAIHTITARTGSAHVTALNARQMVFAVGGSWPRRLHSNTVYHDFEVEVYSPETMQIGIKDGILCAYGCVIENDATVFLPLTAASGDKYKKATVYISFVHNDDGTDTTALDVKYSAEGLTENSINYPSPGVNTSDPYIFPNWGEGDYGPKLTINLAHVLIQGGTIMQCDNIIPLWDGKQFFAPGDELDISYMVAAGYIAANAQNIYCFIPFNKDLYGITSATLSGNVTIRHADGGFIGSSSGQTLASLGTVNVYLYPTGAYVRCILDSASTYANQSVISACFASGAKLTFH